MLETDYIQMSLSTIFPVTASPVKNKQLYYNNEYTFTLKHSEFQRKRKTFKRAYIEKERFFAS